MKKVIIIISIVFLFSGCSLLKKDTNLVTEEKLTAEQLKENERKKFEESIKKLSDNEKIYAERQKFLEKEKLEKEYVEYRKSLTPEEIEEEKRLLKLDKMVITPINTITE